MTDDLIRRAFRLAYDAHAAQKYSGDDPYLLHLFDTYNVLLLFDHREPELLAAALLHDVIEDTPINYRGVLEATNEAVAEIVYACTDELGRNRRERKVRTLQHLHAWTTQRGEAALTVKLADWIANVRCALRDNTRKDKLQMYRKDWAEFSEFRVRFPCDNLEMMWEWLQEQFE
jgi:(p)ppGpp synthase/HD superfamily hydrolase